MEREFQHVIARSCMSPNEVENCREPFLSPILKTHIQWLQALFCKPSNQQCMAIVTIGVFNMVVAPPMFMLVGGLSYYSKQIALYYGNIHFTPSQKQQHTLLCGGA